MRAPAWLSLVAFLAVAGMLGAAGLAGHAQKGGTLRIGEPSDVGADDPGVDFATCAKLYNFPDKPAPEGTLVVPEIAKSVPSVSRDGETQTIELRNTYRFHTGARITTANFVAALNRAANPDLDFYPKLYMHEIVGADAVMEGKAQTISGVKALGPYTLRIRTTRPLGDLMSRLTLFCPIPTATPPVELEAPIGSGPYYVASHVPNRQLVLERNRFYRGQRPANVDRVVFTLGVAPEACRLAVERNQLDYCPFLAPSAYTQIAARYGVNKDRFFFEPTLQTWFFAFNHDRPAFAGASQIPLKQAINWALDRPALVRAFGYLGGQRTDQILPPGVTRQESIYPLKGVTERSLSRAKTLLAKARFRPPKLVLYAASGGTGPDWAQIFQFDLRRIGIDVEIKYFPFPTLLEKASTRGEPFDVVFSAWNVDYADPVTFFRPLLHGDTIEEPSNTNFAYFDRPKYNRAIDRIDGLTGAARRKAWADLDVEMMRDDPPWAPFMNSARRIFVSKSFGCVVVQPNVGDIDLAAACKK